MFIGILIELNWTLFDSIQRESDLITGFNIEYHNVCDITKNICINFFIWIYKYYIYKSNFKINKNKFYGFNYSSIEFIICLFHIYLIIWVI